MQGREPTAMRPVDRCQSRIVKLNSTWLGTATAARQPATHMHGAVAVAAAGSGGGCLAEPGPVVAAPPARRVGETRVAAPGSALVEGAGCLIVPGAAPVGVANAPAITIQDQRHVWRSEGWV